MVNAYIKERINDQTTICAGGVTSNTTYLGNHQTLTAIGSREEKFEGLGTLYPLKSLRKTTRKEQREFVCLFLCLEYISKKIGYHNDEYFFFPVSDLCFYVVKELIK